MTNAYNCVSDYATIPAIAALLSQKKILCISSTQEGIYTYKKGLYTYSYQNVTNITYQLSTALGTYDTTGVLIDVNFTDPTDYSNKIRDLSFISNSTNNYIAQNVKAIEYTFTTYDPNLDVFVTNLFVRIIFY